MDVHGYRLDTGPSVITMPDVLEETFAAVGDSLRDRVVLHALDPVYDARFADGTRLRVHSAADAMVEEVRAFAGEAEARGYLRLRGWLGELYRAEYDRFMAANIDSPLSMLTPQLARVVALGGFSTVQRGVARHLRDERLQRVFTFQSLYVGVAPHRALGVYAVIAYMDTVAGAFFPEGGIRVLPDALARSARAAGVELHYRRTVSQLERRGRRVTAILTEDGERFPCDAVVLTTEPGAAYDLLDRAPRRPVALRPAPSAVVAHLGVPRGWDTAHHTISFGARWHETLREIIDDGRTMSDPSLLITRPTATDPALAPPGHDQISVLAPVPHLGRRRGVPPIDWDRDGKAYAEEIIATAMRRLLAGDSAAASAAASAEILALLTPADWARAGMVAGTPFSYAHTLAQTGPFRPRNLPSYVDNVVLAGSGTVPGVGVPPALISGRLAADRITGPIRPGASGRVRSPR
jgi:phytoene desaturase